MGHATESLLIFIGFIIALGFLWAFTGGPDRAISQQGWFLNSPFVSDGAPVNDIPSVYIPDGGSSSEPRDTPQVEEEKKSFFDFITNFNAGTGASKEEASPYQGQITLSVSGAKQSDEKREYITLKTSRNLDKPLTISGWRIESSATGAGTTIGQAAHLPFFGGVSTELPISIGKNTTVFLITGRSPNGVSFRVNQCTGYFAQFQEITPRLKSSCPKPVDELFENSSVDFVPSDACIDFVENIRQCTFTQTEVPGNIGSGCRSFILETLTYNGCIESHKNDVGFYEDEWYVYLNHDQELWKNSRERIRLLDENGKVVDAITY